MRVAILTDIHANREAFEACLGHARSLKAERFAVLGDLVGYGADPAYTVDMAMRLAADGAIVLKGNHDAAVDGSDANLNATARAAIAFTRRHLDAGQRAFLAALPLTAEEGEVLYTHANGYSPGGWDYVTGPIEARRSIERSGHRVTFCGHVHVPALYHLDDAGRIGCFRPSASVAIPLLRQRRWLAVVGAVGQPRDGSPAAAYALFDSRALSLRFLRVAYDCEAAARKIFAAGLPETLALRLVAGR